MSIIERIKSLRKKTDGGTKEVEPIKIKHVSLSNYLKKRFVQDYGEISKIISQTSVDRNYGVLPPAWIKLFPKDKDTIREATIKIRKALSDFSQKTFSEGRTPVKNFNKAMKRLSKELSKILKVDTEVSYLAEGHYGKVFKIVTNGKDAFTLKTFHKDYNSFWARRNEHGEMFEVPRALFVSKNTPRKTFAKFYMGKVGDEKTREDSFILSLFQDEKNSKNITPDHHYKNKTQENILRDKNKHFILSMTSLVMSYNASPSNKVKDTNIDLGTLKLNKELLDKEFRKIAKEVALVLGNDDVEEAKKLKEQYKDNEKFEKVNAFFHNHFENRYLDFPDYRLRPKAAMKELGIKGSTPEKCWTLDRWGDEDYSEAFKYFSVEEVIGYQILSGKSKEMLEEEEFYTEDMINESLEVLVKDTLDEIIEETSIKEKYKTADNLGEIIIDGGFSLDAIDQSMIVNALEANVEEELLLKIGFDGEQISSAKKTAVTPRLERLQLVKLCNNFLNGKWLKHIGKMAQRKTLKQALMSLKPQIKKLRLIKA